MSDYPYEWDKDKNVANQVKHGVSFEEASQAFEDPHRIFTKDITHSIDEERLYCIGKIARGIVMVRFTYRGNSIRIFGAGFWRRGKELYEQTHGR
jgi:uncharacterized DUF497 family protein